MGDRARWRRLQTLPVLGGLVRFVGMIVQVYDAIGWSDPTYTIRTGEERLAEAQRVASTVRTADEVDSPTHEEVPSETEPHTL